MTNPKPKACIIPFPYKFRKGFRSKSLLYDKRDKLLVTIQTWGRKATKVIDHKHSRRRHRNWRAILVWMDEVRDYLKDNCY